MLRGVAKCQRHRRNYYLFISLALLWEPWVSIPQSFRNHNLQEEIPTTPLILIPNLVQETNKLQMDTPGCFLNPSVGTQRQECLFNPYIPPYDLVGISTFYRVSVYPHYRHSFIGNHICSSF